MKTPLENVNKISTLAGSSGLYGLLHFTGVLGTKNDHLLLGQIDRDGGGRGHTGGESVCWESTGVVDDIVWVEVLELFARWANKHVAHEKGVVGAGADNTDINAVALVPAGESINNVDSVPCVQVVDSTLAVDLPDLGGGKVSI